ncbi:MAG: aminomethyl-transferring glycine dehydrogenase subunit GcvPA [Desulfovibrionaceae bacterium]|nr:aminomethyl-transferring glycine dehydrogenase subunit GcvPA [Desulfovibrionaceae bacterium]
MPYIPHTEEETRAMLDCVGVRTLDDLFADIAPSMRPQHFDVPKGQSEMEVCARLEALAARNHTNVVSFLGAGFYDHHIPRAVDALTGRGEFFTAYTPYQPEVSQGTLQAIFEFQTAICRLLDMECANASVYDGGSALFEAGMMAIRVTKRRRLVVDEAVNPIWRTMLASYTRNLQLELVTVPHRNGVSDQAALKAALGSGAGGECAAVIVQNPNFFGVIDDYTDLFAHARGQGALGIISVYPVMQSVLKTPGDMGADIAVADGQALGMPLSFGGPYLGLMTCTKALIRQMPGRIVGRTSDVDGRPGYVLTLQAREQHIRRAKATSNICSNQALCALRSLVHLSLLGPEGLTRSAELGMNSARYAAERLCALPGVSTLNDAPFGNEVALKLPVDAYGLADALTRQGYVPGFPVGRYYSGMDNVLLVACTEKHSREHIGMLAELMGAALRAQTTKGGLL